ncbi:hypothetical protein B0H17DRAFT_1197813 [Mycena rosella]|uniref:MYND-type domain-containing protein n=1 Tax=Mycena rosella TaxID=1033263 RepID=A0AAD7GIN0_MYCRO|nr:hypothetical protein B0H17DRAFT_1197813 [Mycena rosella]
MAQRARRCLSLYAGPWPNAAESPFWTAQPCGGSGVFLLISRLSGYSPSFTTEVLSAEMMMPCALVHLEQALDRFEAKNPTETFRLVIASVTLFLHGIPTRCLVRLIYDFNDILLDLAGRIQPALEEMPGPEAVFAKQWWTSLHIGIQLGPTYQWVKFGSAKFDPVAAMHRPPADSTEVYRLMRAHRTRIICKKPNCAHRAEPVSKAMMFCRRCALSCHCNAECQKQAWSKGDIPHKGLCNAVDALRRKTGLDNDTLWKDVLTRPGVKAEGLFAQICDTKGVDTAMLEDIAVEIRQHKTAMWVAGVEY